MRSLGDNAISNPDALTGDFHSLWVAELKTDFTAADAPVVGAEFVCSSISSVFGAANHAAVTATLPTNPHVRHFDGLHRGYALCTVTPDQWRTDFRAVTRMADPVLTVPAADLAGIRPGLLWPYCRPARVAQAALISLRSLRARMRTAPPGTPPQHLFRGQDFQDISHRQLPRRSTGPRPCGQAQRRLRAGWPA
jgi:hypothetical protein